MKLHDMPDEFMYIDTGEIRICPLTGQVEMPPFEGYMQNDSHPVLWYGCAFMDANRRQRGEDGYDPGDFELHVAKLKEAQTAGVTSTDRL